MWEERDVDKAIAMTRGVTREWRTTIAADERFDEEDVVQDLLIKYLEYLKTQGEHPHTNKIRDWVYDVLRESYGYVGSKGAGALRTKLRSINIKSTDGNTDEETLDALALGR